MITQKQYENMKRTMMLKGQDITIGDTLSRILDEVLAAGNIEVEDPSVMPDISPGKWKQVQHTDHKNGYCVRGNGVAVCHIIRNSADAVFLAGSKALAEAVIAWLEEGYLAFAQWPDAVYTKQMESIVDALDDMGCNVGKFRKDVARC